MSATEEIDGLIARFTESMPRTVMAKMERNNIGIGMVLRYLEETGHPVSAGEISRYMNVSTARVAVLLRTMSEKGLIVRSDDSTDGRKICIELSAKGRERITQAREDLHALMAEIVNKIGAARLEEFFAIAEEINAAVAEAIAEKAAHGALCMKNTTE